MLAISAIVYLFIFTARSVARAAWVTTSYHIFSKMSSVFRLTPHRVQQKGVFLPDFTQNRRSGARERAENPNP